MNTASWPVIESKTEYRNPWYEGGYDRVRQPDGSSKRYYWVELAPAAVVVALFEGEIVMVEQYRPTVKTRQLELPAGLVDEGETFVQAGVRELREETGFEAGEATLLQEFDVATGVLRHHKGVVFASDLREGEPQHDSNEFIRVKTVPVDRAVEAVRTPPTNDSAITGLLLAREDGLLD